MSQLSLSAPLLAAHPIPGGHQLAAMRGVVASVWHGLWQTASTSPWIAIVVMIPAVALLVGCTRVTVRRG